MSALDDARAAVYDYRHPERGKPGVNLHRAMAALRALIAEHERLTAPPTDGERETAWVEHTTGFVWRDEEQRYGEYRLFLAGYAAGFRRRDPITDDTITAGINASIAGDIGDYPDRRPYWVRRVRAALEAADAQREGRA